jgi:hypothetical protein
MVFFNFFYIKSSQSDDLVQGYCRLTQVDSPLITQVTCLSQLLELTLAFFCLYFIQFCTFKVSFQVIMILLIIKKIIFFIIIAFLSSN